MNLQFINQIEDRAKAAALLYEAGEDILAANCLHSIANQIFWDMELEYAMGFLTMIMKHLDIDVDTPEPEEPVIQDGIDGMDIVYTDNAPMKYFGKNPDKKQETMSKFLQQHHERIKITSEKQK